MENTRIFRLLSSISIPTFNRFVKFVHSPYHNVNKKVTKLVDILYNVIKQGSAVPVKKELWLTLDFKDLYQDHKFRKLCNDVLVRYEDFLITEELKKNDLQRSNLLVQAIQNHDHVELFDKEFSKHKTKFYKTIDASSEFYLNDYKFQKSVESIKIKYEKKENILKNITQDSIIDLNSKLDSFYVIENLKNAIDIITWNSQFKGDFKYDLSLYISI